MSAMNTRTTMRLFANIIMIWWILTSSTIAVNAAKNDVDIAAMAHKVDASVFQAFIQKKQAIAQDQVATAGAAEKASTSTNQETKQQEDDIRVKVLVTLKLSNEEHSRRLLEEGDHGPHIQASIAEAQDWVLGSVDQRIVQLNRRLRITPLMSLDITEEALPLLAQIPVSPSAGQ